jgi:hypothetical protein
MFPRGFLERCAWVEEHARVKRLVREVSEASLAILHHHRVVARAAAASRRTSPR